MPMITEMFPSKYMRNSDLNGRPMRVTIAEISRENLNGESKYVVSFSNQQKRLILNKTNGTAIARLLGGNSDNWIGQEIILAPVMVDFKGDQVPSIRVRSVPQPTKPAANEPPPWDDLLEDLYDDNSQPAA